MLSKILLKREKMLVTSIFSFSNIVFYHIKEKNRHLRYIFWSSANTFNFGKFTILPFGKDLIGVQKVISTNCIQVFISCFPVKYREISVKIFFDLTLVPPVKIPIFMFLLPRLITRASQPDGNMTSFTLHFPRLT